MITNGLTNDGASKFEYDYCQAPTPKYNPIIRSTQMSVDEDLAYAEAAAAVAAGTIAANRFKLIQVQMITRHGDRAPVNILPLRGRERDVEWSDCGASLPYQKMNVDLPISSYTRKTYIPHNDVLASQSGWKGTCAKGQLTEKGAIQHYKLGSSLRDVYIKRLGFLQSKFDNNEVFVRSTDFWRTQQSVESMLYGFYPLQYRDAGAPIEIHTKGAEVENMYYNPTNCPRLKDEMINLFNSDEFKEHSVKHAKLKERSLSIVNFTKHHDWMLTFDHIFDVVHARKCHDKPLPCNEMRTDCFTDQDVRNLFDAASWEFMFLNSGSEQFRRLVAGPFFGEILDIMHLAVSNVTQYTLVHPKSKGTSGLSVSPKFVIYSGHDSTLSMMIGALGLKDIIWPPYASHLIFELWVDEGDASVYVRLIYNGDVTEIPGCHAKGTDSSRSRLCPWSTFLHLIEREVLLEDPTLCWT